MGTFEDVSRLTFSAIGAAGVVPTVQTQTAQASQTAQSDLQGRVSAAETYVEKRHAAGKAAFLARHQPKQDKRTVVRK